MNWKEKFAEGQELVLATCSKDNQPNANIVISLGFVGNRLLVGDCQMNTTLKNLQATKGICIVGGYFRIKGSVEILSAGKYFDLAVQKTKDYTVKNAIVITIDDVFDLDKCKVIKL